MNEDVKQYAWFPAVGNPISGVCIEERARQGTKLLEFVSQYLKKLQNPIPSREMGSSINTVAKQN